MYSIVDAFKPGPKIVTTTYNDSGNGKLYTQTNNVGVRIWAWFDLKLTKSGNWIDSAGREATYLNWHWYANLSEAKFEDRGNLHLDNLELGGHWGFEAPNFTNFCNASTFVIDVCKNFGLCQRPATR